MKAKTIISGLILIAHIGFSIWYAQLSYSFKMLHENEMIAAFCAVNMILPAFNNGLRSAIDSNYQIGVYKSHNLFMMLVGTIYMLHYTTNIITTSNIQLSIYYSIFLTIFTLVIICLFKHGFFKNKKRSKIV